MKNAVGKQCVSCGKLIDDVHEGHHCDGCNYPIHLDCVRIAGSGRNICSVCGNDLITAATVTRASNDIGPNLTQQGSASASAPPSTTYVHYAQVPWHRRSSVNNIFVILGLLGCFPLVCWTSINLITGDVYFDRRERDGTLATWGIVNKIWAILFALIWAFVFFLACLGAMTGNRAQPMFPD